MVRIKLIRTKAKTYGYIIRDRYSPLTKRSKDIVVRKLSNEEVELFLENKLTKEELIKKE